MMGFFIIQMEKTRRQIQEDGGAKNISLQNVQEKYALV